mgnify:CR=1 FL=1|jgi:hypothetical protein
MKNCAISASIIALTHAIAVNAPKNDKQSRFGQWQAKHNKNYKTTKENDARFAAWSKKDDEITSINSNPKNTFQTGHNKFSDMLPEER